MIEAIREKMKILALSDAILSPDWEYRYFSYNSNWSNAEEMASLRDGCGGEWFLWLTDNLAGYKCLSPEDGLMQNLDEIKNKIPNNYNSFITEPAFSMDTATCLWLLQDSEWQKHGLQVKHLINLDDIISWSAEDYHTFAVEYYEMEIDIKNIENLFSNLFTEELALELNPEIDILELRKEISEIGYKILIVSVSK